MVETVHSGVADVENNVWVWLLVVFFPSFGT